MKLGETTKELAIIQSELMYTMDQFNESIPHMFEHALTTMVTSASKTKLDMRIVKNVDYEYEKGPSLAQKDVEVGKPKMSIFSTW